MSEGAVSMQQFHVRKMFYTLLRRGTIGFLVMVSLSFLATPVGATSHATHQIPAFSTTGQGSVVPRQVSTFTTPQVRVTAHSGTVGYLPAPGGRAHVPSPQNVVRVPAPINANLTTNTKFEGIRDT